MNKKLISGIAIIIVGILLPLLRLFPYPRIGNCFTIGPEPSFIWSCGILNLIPTILLIAIGSYLIAIRNK